MEEIKHSQPLQGLQHEQDSDGLQFLPSASGNTLETTQGQQTIYERVFPTWDALRHLRVQVTAPIGAAPEGGWPVLFMLDGNAVFDELRRIVPDTSFLVIVGIGYDINRTAVADGRAYDYTPLIPGVADLRDPRAFERKAGGADDFMQTVMMQIWPAIQNQFSVNPNIKALYGHSYGGLCVLHTLFRQPGLFNKWVAVSPSLWWHERYILQEAQAFVQQNQAFVQQKSGVQDPGDLTELVLMSGTKEQLRQKPVGVDGITLANRPAGIPTLPWVRDLAEQLSVVQGLQTKFVCLPEADHRGALYASIPCALSFMKQWFGNE